MNSNRTIRASNALDSTLDVASNALEKAGEKVRDLRYSAREIAARGASNVGEYAQATTRYAREEPVKTALIAVAFGALIAGIVYAVTREDKRYF